MKLNGIKCFLIIVSLSMLSSPIFAGGKGKELRRAASSGDLERVTELLEDDADPNSSGQNGGTPLIKAAKSGSIAIVHLRCRSISIK